MFLFAVAAMVSLSSCIQTEEVYTGGVSELGFKSAVTRGIIQTNDQMIYPIAVSAIVDGTNDGVDNYSHYFVNNRDEDKDIRPNVAKYVYDDAKSYWKGEPARYWPTSGNMEFLAFCPYPKFASIITNLNATTGKFESMVVAGIDNNIADQSDVLFSDVLTAQAPDDARATQPLFFHHATAQLYLTFKKTDSQAEVVVNEVYVSNAKLSGTLTITPTAVEVEEDRFTTTAEWSNLSGFPMKKFLKLNPQDVSDTVLDATIDSAVAYSPTPLLVMPSEQTLIHITYTVDGHKQTFIHNLKVDKTGNTITPVPQWEMGKKYTYNYTINVNEILFDCEVEEWTDGNSVGGNIGENVTI